MAKIEDLYYSITSHNLDLVIGAPVIVDSTGMPINKKWPIHWIKEKAPNDFKILDESERLLLSSAFLPESIIGSSASNIYRREILISNPFPTKYGNQGDVAWAIINLPRVKAALLLKNIGIFCWDGERKNSWEQLNSIVINLCDAFDGNKDDINSNNYVADAFMAWLNNSKKRLYRSNYVSHKRIQKLEKILKIYFSFRRQLTQIIFIPRKIVASRFRLFNFALKKCNTLRSQIF
jgi:hypothetical protein